MIKFFHLNKLIVINCLYIRLEEKIGIDDLCKKTGSRAHARFSVHHIHKVEKSCSFFIPLL